MRESFHFLIISLLAIPVNSCYTEQNIEVISSLMQPLNVKQTILVGSWCNGMPERFKLFSKEQIYTVYFSLDKLINYLKEMNVPQSYQKVSIVLKIDEEIEVENVLRRLKLEVSYLGSFLKFNWLIITPEMARKLKPNDFHIPFDCHVFLLEESNKTYKINEIYQIKDESEIVYRNLGYWGEKKTRNILLDDFYKRRKNFRKENLTMIVKDKIIYSDVPEKIHLEFWLDLERMFNFSTNQVEQKDYNLIIMKEDVKIDLAMMHFLKNESENVIAPLMIAKWHMYIKSSQDIIGSWMAYLKPFDSKLWYGVNVCFVVTSIATTLIGWVGINILKLKKYTLFEQALMPLAALCNQCCTQEPSIISARIARIFAYATACVIVPAYSAAIISFLMVSTPNIPFTDLDTFVEDGTYKLASFKRLFVKIYFDFTPRKTEKIIRDRYLISFNDFPVTHEAAIQMVCSFDKISVMNFNYRMFDYPWPCPIIKVSRSIVNLPTGLEMFNYGVHYAKIFRKSLITFREVGIIERWHLYYYGKRSKDPDNELKPLEIMKIVPLLFNIFMGVAFSSLLLTAEIIHDYYKYHRRSKRLFTIPKIDITRSQSEAFTVFLGDTSLNEEYKIVAEGQKDLNTGLTMPSSKNNNE